MIRQLSIFAENRRGAMNAITKVLTEKQINMNTLVTNDSAEFGIIRMVVSDPDRAMEAFKREGYLCRETEVLGVEVADEVGNLNRLLSALDESNINVDYIYLSFSRDSANPIMVFHAQDAAEVEECLQMKGFSMV